MRSYDVLIVGGGVIGCSIAWELSKLKLKVGLLEKEGDVCMGISSSNSGVAHAGFYVRPNTLKAKFNVEGARRLKALCDGLGIPYEKVGKVVVAKREAELKELHRLLDWGRANGVEGLRLIDEEELKSLEPNVEGLGALCSPNSAILCPFTLTIILAENAALNGVDFWLSHEAKLVRRLGNGFLLEANGKRFFSEVLINAAGLGAAKIAEMLGFNYKIILCRGEYHVLDREARGLVRGLVYPVPPSDGAGLGVHLTPTVHGNLLIGPSAEFVDAPESSTTPEVAEKLWREAKSLLPKLEERWVIKRFAGIRPKPEGGDFIVEEEDGLINLLGIESPGLTAAPAIAAHVVRDLLPKAGIEAEKKERLKVRKSKPRFRELPPEEKHKLILSDQNCGKIVCRCELVTKAEVIAALTNPLGARGLKSISMRTRAGMGRCQGAFCTPRIVQLVEGLGHDAYEILGKLFVGEVKKFARCLEKKLT